jgi:glycerol-3-phosphate acyltransferase PlsY
MGCKGCNLKIWHKENSTAMFMIQALGLMIASTSSVLFRAGLLVVRLLSGKDIRTIESGRTGGTNVMRAAGFTAGLITAITDILKATLTVWLVRWFLLPHPLAPGKAGITW